MTEPQYTKYGKKWYEEHKEKAKAKSKEYYEAHKEEKRAYAREYAKLHQEQRKAYRDAHKEENNKKAQKPISERKTRKKLYYDTPNYITVRQYPNSIVLIEAILDDSYDIGDTYKTKIEIERMLNNINNDERIVYVDEYNGKFNIQIYEKRLDYIQLIINNLQTFCEKMQKKVVQ